MDSYRNNNGFVEEEKVGWVLGLHRRADATITSLDARIQVFGMEKCRQLGQACNTPEAT